MSIIPYDEVFTIRTQLKGAEGTWFDGSTLPVSYEFPLLAILSGGDIGEGISKVYTVLVYDGTQYLTQYIDTDGLSGYNGYQRPLSGSEAVVRWKQLTTELPGAGLKGDYYNTRDLTGIIYATRYDTIDFNWSTVPPVLGVGLGANEFSVRWTGHIRIPTTGDYRFRTVSDDGVRLWIDDILVIDNWTTHAVSTDNSPLMTLVEGFVKIKLEYFQGVDGSEIHLLWATPPLTTLFNVIPTASLYNPNYVT